MQIVTNINFGCFNLMFYFLVPSVVLHKASSRNPEKNIPIKLGFPSHCMMQGQLKIKYLYKQFNLLNNEATAT